MRDMPLTREEILRALGDADDTTIAALVGLGVTSEELREAQAWLTNDEPLVSTGRSLPSGRVGELADLLARLEEEKPGPGPGEETS